MMQTTERIASLSGAWEVREREQEESRAPTDRRGAQSPSNALRMELRDWLLLIPDYDGCPHGLERFTSSVRYVASQLGESAERTLLLALGRKLTSRARAALEHRLHRHASIEDLLGELHARFSGLGGEAELLERLHQARQLSGEGVDEFGARLDKLVTQICTIYEEDRDNEAQAREANKKLVRDVALASFRRGLKNSELELRLGAYDPKSLEEAIRAAICADNELQFKRKLLMEMRASCYSNCKKRRRSR